MLKDRQRVILKELVAASDPLVIKNIASKLGVTERTIRYDLDQLEDWLEKYQIDLVRKRGVGVYLNSDDKEKILTEIDLNYKYNRVLSPNERQNVILKELLFRDEPLIIKELSLIMDVSTNTVLKDLDNLEEYLKKKNLSLIRRPNYGIEIKGKESSWRQVVFELLDETSNWEDILTFLKRSSDKKEINTFIDSYQELLKQINEPGLEKIKNIVSEAERKLPFDFADAAYAALVLHISIAVQRIVNNKDINMAAEQFNMLKEKKEYKIAETIADNLEKKFKIDIPETEIGYITLHLLGAKFRNRGGEEVFKTELIDQKTLSLTKKIIETAEKILDIKLIDDSELLYGLALHLKPTLNRLEYNMNIENLLLEDIKKRYPEIYRASSIAAGILQGKIQREINEAEIGYIAMHIGAAVERKKHSREKKARVVLVCSTGIGTTRLLGVRLKQSFPEIKIVDNYSYHNLDIEELKNNEIDLVISTIKLEISKIRNICVNPLLPDEDIELIKSELKKLPFKIKKPSIMNKDSSDKIFEDIYKLVENNVKIKNKSNFKDSLMSLIEKHRDKEIGDVKKELSLFELLKKDFIKIKAKTKNWKSAVRESSKILLEKNIIREKYINSMISNIEKEGPYVVISPGIALVHAAPEDGVIKSGLSLLILKEGVNFNHSKNDPVDFVITLAADGSGNHIKALSQLIKLIYKNDIKEKLKNLDKNEEIIEVLKNY